MATPQNILALTNRLNESRSMGGAGLKDLFPGAASIAYQYTQDLANWNTAYPWVSVADADTASTATLDGGPALAQYAFEFEAFAEDPEQMAEVQDALERYFKANTRSWDKIRGDREDVATYEAFYVADFEPSFFTAQAGGRPPSGGGSARAGGVPPAGSVGVAQLDGALQQFVADALIDVGGATGLDGKFVRRDGSEVDDPRTLGLTDMLDALQAEGGAIGIVPTLAGNVLTLSWVTRTGTQHLAVTLPSGSGRSSHTDAAITALAGALMGGSARFNWDAGTSTLTDVATGTALIADGAVTRAKLDQTFLASLDAKSNVLQGTEDFNDLTVTGAHWQETPAQLANAPFNGPLALIVKETSQTVGRQTTYGVAQFAKQQENGQIAVREVTGLRSRPTSITADWSPYHPWAHYPDTDAATGSVIVPALEDTPAGFRPNPLAMTMALDSSGQYLSAAPNQRGIRRVANDTRAWPSGYLHGTSPERGGLYIEVADSALTGGWSSPSRVYYRRVGTGDPWEVLPINILWDGVDSLLLKTNGPLTTGQAAELQGRIELYIDYTQFRARNLVVLPGHNVPENIGHSKLTVPTRNGRPDYTTPSDVDTRIANRVRGFADLNTTDKVARGDLERGQQLPAAPADQQIPKWSAASGAWVASADETGSGGAPGQGQTQAQVDGRVGQLVRPYGLVATADADAKAGLLAVLAAAFTGTKLDALSDLFDAGAVTAQDLADGTVGLAKVTNLIQSVLLPITGQGDPAVDDTSAELAAKAGLVADLMNGRNLLDFQTALTNIPHGLSYESVNDLPAAPTNFQHVNLLQQQTKDGYGVVTAAAFTASGTQAAGWVDGTPPTGSVDLPPDGVVNSVTGIAAYGSTGTGVPANRRNRVVVILNAAAGKVLRRAYLRDVTTPGAGAWHNATRFSAQDHRYALTGTTAASMVDGRRYEVRFEFTDGTTAWAPLVYGVGRWIWDATQWRWIEQGQEWTETAIRALTAAWAQAGSTDTIPRSKLPSSGYAPTAVGHVTVSSANQANNPLVLAAGANLGATGSMAYLELVQTHYSAGALFRVRNNAAVRVPITYQESIPRAIDVTSDTALNQITMRRAAGAWLHGDYNVYRL